MSWIYHIFLVNFGLNHPENTDDFLPKDIGCVGILKGLIGVHGFRLGTVKSIVLADWFPSNMRLVCLEVQDT